MFEICSEFAMISIEGAIERVHSMRLAMDKVVFRLRLLTNSLQISNFHHFSSLLLDMGS